MKSIVDFFNKILVPLILALSIALINAYTDIQKLKDRVEQLNKSRDADVMHNENQFNKIDDKLDKIYMLLINKDK